MRESYIIVIIYNMCCTWLKCAGSDLYEESPIVLSVNKFKAKSFKKY